MRERFRGKDRRDIFGDSLVKTAKQTPNQNYPKNNTIKAFVKKHYVNIICGVLLTSGIGLIGYGYLNKYQARSKEQLVMKTLTEELSKLPKKISETGNDKVVPEVITLKNNISGLGILSIKSLNIKAPIMEGITKETLNLGVAHMKNTALPGISGNCVIGGHSSSNYVEPFNYLYKIKKNEIIEITTSTKAYKYVVTDIQTVSPSKISVTKATYEPTLTLITCVDRTLKRLIIKASLIS